MALLAAMAMHAASAPARSGFCGAAGEPPARASHHQLRTSMLCLINRAREHRGIQSLRYSEQLRRAATGHSEDMVRRGYFSHYGPNGGDITVRIARAGYLSSASAYAIGENIGGGPGRRFGSAIAVFRSWMHSPEHRANIFDRRFRDFGVGVARGYPLGGGREAATFTLDLGSRR